MKEYEGRCPYCTNAEFILAETQVEADALVTERCGCVGSMRAKKTQEVSAMIDGICEKNERWNLDEVDDDTKDAIKGISRSIVNGTIRKATIEVKDSQISIKGGDTISIKRETKVEIETEVES